MRICTLFLMLALLFIAAPRPGRTASEPGSPSASGANARAEESDGNSAVLVGAADVAVCRDLSGARSTAKLIEKIPGTVFVAGDLAVPDGSAQEFADCYDPTWGKFKNRTRPAPGNHEYHAGDAAPYFKYFGAAAGDPAKGYYSYELGDWHIVSLNSNCNALPDGCAADSAEIRWLKHDLAEHPAACTLAYWHHPLFSSGLKHGDDMEMRPFWQALYAANADVVLNGHDHDYERFAPQDPDGNADPKRGIREFVVGTGGNPSHHAFGLPVPNSEFRGPDIYGVLKLTLHPDSYEWLFISIAGKVLDSGTGACH